MENNIVTNAKYIYDININKEEVLRYLGYNGQNIDINLNDKIDFCIDETKDNVDIKYTYEVFDIETDIDSNTVSFKDCNFKIHSKDVSKLLINCDQCILMAVTLGFRIEQNIRRYSYNNLTKGIIIDSCATTSVEEVCDRLQQHINYKFSKENKYLTMRYSPGYGDLDIKINKEILNLLNANKTIGVSVTDAGIMMPRKSVVALIGVSKFEIKQEKRTCENCLNKNNCEYRRKADGCGDKTIYKK